MIDPDHENEDRIRQPFRAADGSPPGPSPFLETPILAHPSPLAAAALLPVVFAPRPAELRATGPAEEQAARDSRTTHFAQVQKGSQQGGKTSETNLEAELS